MSHRNTTRKTYYLEGGIEVHVTQRTEASRLIMIIPKRLVIKEDTIKRKNKYLSVNLQKKRKINNTVSVKVRIPYEFDEKGIIEENALNLVVEDENFTGTIIVFPRFYLSKATRKINDKKFEKAYINPPREKKYFTSNQYDNYTHNNAKRPYRG